jgi:hypothetical protein
MHDGFRGDEKVSQAALTGVLSTAEACQGYTSQVHMPDRESEKPNIFGPRAMTFPSPLLGTTIIYPLSLGPSFY